MNGILIINKQKNCTSHDIVYKVKRMVNQKVGHIGTLDPMATGVLPLLIGKGTLCSKYLINHDKIYKAILKLGQETDTQDAEGIVIKEEEVSNDIFDEGKIKEILKSFLGEQEQIPPMYSAIKVKGKKLYEYARKKEKVEIPSRKINIYDIKLINIDEKQKEISFEVKCSKGTYIRTLCSDIAKKLGSIGYMIDLKRIQVGEFNINDSVTLKEIENNPKLIQKRLITIEEIFKNKENIDLDDKKLQLFLNGVQLTVNLKEDVYKIYNGDNFIGIGIVEDNKLKRDIIEEAF